MGVIDDCCEYCNDKERDLYNILDIVVRCCTMRARNGSLAVNRDDVLGTSRETNTVMTRCILVSSILDAGYSVSTAAALLGRIARGIRHLLALGRHYWRTSCAYRTAVEEVKRARIKETHRA